MTVKSPLAEVIAVGSELLSDGRSETNSLMIAGYLGRLGIEIRRKLVVGDDPDRLAEAFQQARSKASIILITGGLGPTADDITREVVAAQLDRKLQTDEPSLERLRSIYRRLRLEIKENSLRQAMAPEGAEVLVNDHGTAPGLLLRDGSRLIFLLPGPPRELKPMLEEQVMPRLVSNFKMSPLPFRTLRVASLAESAVDARIQPILALHPGIQYTILSNPGLIEVIFRATEDNDESRSRLASLLKTVSSEFGADVYSTEAEEISMVIGRILKTKGWTLASAESCTGGYISSLLTELSGSSEFYVGGIISYSNQVKHDLLGVSSETLKNFGAVSAQTAEEMAAGVCRQTRAPVGISVTGIAGPGGGSPEKPVGTVWFGASVNGQITSTRRCFGGDRALVRLRASHFALDWLRRKLLG